MTRQFYVQLASFVWHYVTQMHRNVQLLFEISPSSTVVFLRACEDYGTVTDLCNVKIEHLKISFAKLKKKWN